MVMARPKVKPKDKPKDEKLIKPKPKIMKKKAATAVGKHDVGVKKKKSSDPKAPVKKKAPEAKAKDSSKHKTKVSDGKVVKKKEEMKKNGQKKGKEAKSVDKDVLSVKALKKHLNKKRLLAKLRRAQKRNEEIIARFKAKRAAAKSIKRKYMKLEKRMEVIRELRPALHNFISLVKAHRMLDAASSQSLQEVKHYMKMAAIMKLTGYERQQIMAVMDEQVKQVKGYQHMLSEIIFEMAESALPFCRNDKVRQAMAEARQQEVPNESEELTLEKIERAKAIALAKGRAYAARLLSKGSRSRRRGEKCSVVTGAVAANAVVATPKNEVQKARISARFEETVLEEKIVASATPKKGRGGRTSTAARTPASARSAKTRRRDSGGDAFSPMSPNQSEASVTPSMSGRGGRGGGRRGGGLKRAATASVTRKPRRSSGRRGGRKRSSSDETVEYIPGAGPDEPTYCLCKRISFGDMIGCDNDKCVIEWFHFECVHLKTKPKGKKWYCPNCRGDRPTVPKKNL